MLFTPVCGARGILAEWAKSRCESSFLLGRDYMLKAGRHSSLSLIGWQQPVQNV